MKIVLTSSALASDFPPLQGFPVVDRPTLSRLISTSERVIVVCDEQQLLEPSDWADLLKNLSTSSAVTVFAQNPTAVRGLRPSDSPARPSLGQNATPHKSLHSLADLVAAIAIDESAVMASKPSFESREINSYLEHVAKALKADHIRIYTINVSGDQLLPRPFGTADAPSEPIPIAHLPAGEIPVAPVAVDRAGTVSVFCPFTLDLAASVAKFILPAGMQWSDEMLSACESATSALAHLLLIRHLQLRSRVAHKVAITDPVTREGEWAILIALRHLVPSTGAALFEVLERNGSSLVLSKTFVHHLHKQHDQLDVDHGHAHYCITHKRALLFERLSLAANGEEIGEGFEYEPERPTAAEGRPIRLLSVRPTNAVEQDHSTMYVPLMVESECIGCLKLAQFEAKPFRIDHLRDFASCAPLVAQPVATGRRHRRLETEIDQHRRVTVERGDALFLRELLEQILHNLAQDLTQQEANLLGLGGSDLTEEAESYLEKAEFYSTKVRESIRRGLQMIRSMRSVPQEARLIADVVQPAITNAEQRVADTSTRITHSLRQQDFLVQVDVRMMIETMMILLNNSIWAVRERGHGIRGNIRVMVRQSDVHRVDILVRDNGIGIHPAQMSYVFKPGWTTRDGGSGLGLFLARRLLRQYGGDVTVARSVHNKGTVMSISLPFLETSDR